MLCKACKKPLNKIPWYTIFVDDIKQTIGGEAYLKKVSLAESLVNKSYMNHKSGSHVTVEKMYHCFNCGGHKLDVIFSKIIP